MGFVIIGILLFIGLSFSILKISRNLKFNIDFIKKYEVLDFYYKTFYINKRDGSKRKIQAPNDRLKKVQRNILNELEKKYFLPNFITAFRKNIGIKYNARKHVGKKVIINIDIKDFFENINEDKVTNRFKYYKNIDEKDIEKFIKITMNNGSLPQGAPTSPFIANFVFLPIDYVILNLLKKYDKNVGYSRYADDITFSSNNDKIKNAIRIIIDSILPNHGFEAKKKKTTLYRNHTRQIVTGLVVNEKVSYPRNKYMLLRSVIHNFLLNGVGDKEKIKGHLSFLKNVDFNKYLKLKLYYQNKFDKNIKYGEIF